MDRNYVCSDEAEKDAMLFSSTFVIDNIYKDLGELAKYEKLLGFGNELKPIFMRVHCKIGARSYSSGYRACNFYVETITLDGMVYGFSITQGAYMTLMNDLEVRHIDIDNYSLQGLLRNYLNTKHDYTILRTWTKKEE